MTKGGKHGELEHYTVTKVTEYLWKYTVKWELLAFAGVDSDKAIVFDVSFKLFQYYYYFN